MSFTIFTESKNPLNNGTDVLFLIDSSRGVTPQLYQVEKDFVKSMYDQFDIKPSGPRGSAVIYSDNPYVVSRFTDSNLKEKVDAARFIGKSRRIDNALDYATRLYSAMGRGGRKVVVLLTAGRTAPGSAPLDKAAEPLRKLGVQTFVVNIGRRVQNSEFNSLVDRSEDVIKVAPDALDYLSESISKKVREKKGRALQF